MKNHNEKTIAKLAYSIPEAAQVIGISPRKFHDLLSGGYLASVRIGGRRLIRHADLAHFVAGLEEWSA